MGVDGVPRHAGDASARRNHLHERVEVARLELRPGPGLAHLAGVESMAAQAVVFRPTIKDGSPASTSRGTSASPVRVWLRSQANRNSSLKMIPLTMSPVLGLTVTIESVPGIEQDVQGGTHVPPQCEGGEGGIPEGGRMPPLVPAGRTRLPCVRVFMPAQSVRWIAPPGRRSGSNGAALLCVGPRHAVAEAAHVDDV